MRKILFSILILSILVPAAAGQVNAPAPEDNEEFYTIVPAKKGIVRRGDMFGYPVRERRSMLANFGNALGGSYFWRNDRTFDLGGGFTAIPITGGIPLRREYSEQVFSLTLDVRLYVLRSEYIYAYVTGGLGPALRSSYNDNFLVGSRTAYGFGEYIGAGIDLTLPLPVWLNAEYRFQNVNYLSTVTAAPTRFHHIWLVGIRWSWFNV